MNPRPLRKRAKSDGFIMERKDRERLERSIGDALKKGGLITVMTGAGVSAESGIPTFRGPEGYWTVGSVNYQPSEIATNDMLNRNPREVWKWFLFRRGVCADALPNPGHVAIAEMEKLLKDKNRFRLITQNVDGLHLRAGNTLEATYQVHGNLNFMRCFGQCASDLYPVPETIPKIARGEELPESEWERLKCPKCGTMARPHVLLWDEYYDEKYYRFESSLRDAAKTSLLVIVGTTGSTNLPNRVAASVMHFGGTIIDIDIEENVFSKAALQTPGGLFLKGKSAEILPVVFDAIEERISDSP